MSIGVFFCTSGGIVSEKIDPEAIRSDIESMEDVAFYEVCNHVSGLDGAGTFVPKIKESGVDRVIFAACSPRDHEPSFQKVMADAGCNPFNMQMVNVREQIAWVTEDPQEAAEKARKMIRSAIRRVSLHEPLSETEITMNDDVLIIGAGPAGLKAALTLAEANRKIILVEKSPIIGGKAVYFDEVFPNLECGPCMLEPMEGEILNGPPSKNIDLMLMSEVAQVSGFFGNFIVDIEKKPRFVDVASCIGCNECVEVCPVEYENNFNDGYGTRRAIDFALMGGLPLAPYIDMERCVRSNGESCTKCDDICMMEGCINLDDKGETVTRKVGTIIVAIGAELYKLDGMPNLGLGQHPDILTSYQMERMLATNGPTEGKLQCADGKEPKKIAVVHCAGSLDDQHCSYCSSICCQNAFKFNQLIHHKAHDAQMTHFYKTIVTTGKDGATLCAKSTAGEQTTMVRFTDINDLKVNGGDGITVAWKDSEGNNDTAPFDLVILMPAVVPAKDNKTMQDLLEISSDPNGFFSELHARVDAVSSSIRGIYIAGSCREPGDIGAAFTDGTAAAGMVLSSLQPGTLLKVDPAVAEVESASCSGCKSCLNVCPYNAISMTSEGIEAKADVNAVLCTGCGTCVAACPANAIENHHFTNDQIYAEIQEALA